MSESSKFIDSKYRRLDPNQPHTMDCPECWHATSCLSAVCQCGFHIGNFRKEQVELREKHKRLSRNAIRKRVGHYTSLSGILCLIFLQWQGIGDIPWQLLSYALIATGVVLICTLKKEVR
jgi:hypothetical protein